jgi:hypothetical protein
VTITIVGDFADALSFLATQRAEHIRSLGLHDVRWLAGVDALTWLAQQLPHRGTTTAPANASAGFVDVRDQHRPAPVS